MACSSASPALPIAATLGTTPTNGNSNNNSNSNNNNMLDILSSAAVNRTSYQPSSPGQASRVRGGHLAAVTPGGWNRFSSVSGGGGGGGGSVSRGPRSATGSNHSEAGSRSSIHELMIGESWGPAPGMGKQTTASSCLSSTTTAIPVPVPVSLSMANGATNDVSNPTTVRDADGDVKPEVMEVVAEETGAESDVNEIMWDLLWPGWTKELPDPALMHHM